MNPLLDLQKAGQSVWLDFITRGLMTDGGLQKLISEDGLRGVTSNPTIFQKALAGGSDYDAAIHTLIQKDKATPEIFEDLAVEDIQRACDLFRPAIEQALGEGININVTLIFALDRFQQFLNAWLAGLERLAKAGKPLNTIASVASFFVSRVDSLVDKLLERKP